MCAYHRSVTKAAKIDRAWNMSIKPGSMHRLRRYLPIRFVLAVLFSAQGLSALPTSGVSGRMENDIGFSDSYYTDGARFTYISTPNETAGSLNPARIFLLPFRAFGVADGSSSPKAEAAWPEFSEWGMGLDTYTPRYLTKSAVSTGDHPYASWGYALAASQVHGSTGSIGVELQIGAMGPRTGSDKAQRLIHQGSKYGSTPNGWDHQMPYAPGAQVAVSYEHRFFRQSDGDTWAGFFLKPRAGSMHTDLETGLEARVGFEALSDAISSLAGSRTRWQWYFRSSAIYVGHNSAIEGAPGHAMDIYSENRAAEYFAFSTLSGSRAGVTEGDKYDAFVRLVDRANRTDYRTGLLQVNKVFYSSVTATMGEQALVYEALFREGRPYENPPGNRMRTLHFFVVNSTPLTFENAWLYADTFARPDGRGMNPLTRWIAYQKIAARNNFNPTEQAAIFIILFNHGRFDQRTYGAVPRRFLVHGEAGAAFGSDKVKADLGVRVESISFEGSSGTPDFHAWWSLGVTYLF